MSKVAGHRRQLDARGIAEKPEQAGEDQRVARDRGDHGAPPGRAPAVVDQRDHREQVDRAHHHEHHDAHDGQPDRPEQRARGREADVGVAADRALEHRGEGAIADPEQGPEHDGQGRRGGDRREQRRGERQRVEVAEIRRGRGQEQERGEQHEVDQALGGRPEGGAGEAARPQQPAEPDQDEHRRERAEGDQHGPGLAPPRGPGQAAKCLGAREKAAGCAACSPPPHGTPTASPSPDDVPLRRRA
jgi:hypothetical protein